MRKTLLFAVLLCALGAFAKDGFQPLFNGKNLDGWDGDPRLWSVKDGMIVGSTEGTPLEYNSFLITKKTYANFILKAQAKLRNHNSGIQFRSEEVPGLKWAVRGYQADMAENNYWGCIYEERGTRGILVNGWKDKAEKVVKLTDWNDLELLCDGDHINLKVNGLETADLHDSAKLDGIIALQLHKGPPMQVYFRNIEIKELWPAGRRAGLKKLKAK
jgi:ribosome modulation factor